METSDWAQRAYALTAAVIVTALAAAANRAVIANFVPVYGAHPLAGAANVETERLLGNLIIGLLIAAHQTRGFPQHFLSGSSDFVFELYVGLVASLKLWERILLFPLSNYVAASWAPWPLVFSMFVASALAVGRLLTLAFPFTFRTTTEESKTRWITYLLIFGIVTALQLVYWEAHQVITKYLLTFYGQWSSWLSRSGSEFEHRLQLQDFIAFLLCLSLARYIPSRTWTFVLGTMAITNIVFSNPMLNLYLQRYDWSILARGESTTGYISVLENSALGLRALRNDHSLLGGHWLLTPERKAQGFHSVESIYSAFYMLEAVRLMELDDAPEIPTSNQHETALVIGLGIGTAPAALSAHGINTTVVELDPLVIHYAQQYFELTPSPNLHIIAEDALSYTARGVSTAASSPVSKHKRKYNYIIHDVFTSRAEPAALFTTSFLTSLRDLLDPKDGRIVINYAGNLRSTTTLDALGRIIRVFEGAGQEKEGRCRIYRDSAPPSGSSESDGISKGPDDADFANFMTFCTPSSKNWHFRSPMEADYLSTGGRREALVPKYEVHPDCVAFTSAKIGELDGERARKIKEERVRDAERHWKIMRKVIPAVVWENY